MTEFGGLTMSEALADPALFGQHFAGPSWATWHAVFKATFGERLSRRERQLFHKVAGDRQPPSRRVAEMVALKGRGGGGSSAAAEIASYCAISFDGHARLRPGERGVVAVIAYDKAQARQVARFIRGLFDETPVLASMVESADSDTISLSNKIDIIVFANNFRSVRGRSLVAAIFDEACFWRDEHYSSPDTEVHAAVTPGLGRVRGSILVIVSSVYRRAGLAYSMWQESFGRDDPHRLVVLGSTTDFNPSFDAKIIERDLAKDRARFAAEYLSEWRDDIGSFLAWALIEQAAVLDPTGAEPVRGTRYFCGIDHSGGRRDAMVMAIAHRAANGRIVVDLVYGRKPPFGPQEVAAEFAGIVRKWGMAQATADNYGAEWVTSAFAAHGVRIVPPAFPKSQTYLEIEPLFAQGIIDIPRNPTLMAELRDLERRPHVGGKDTVDHPPSSNFHDDHANALALAAQLAASKPSGMVISEAALRWAAGSGGAMPVSWR